VRSVTDVLAAPEAELLRSTFVDGTALSMM